MSTVFRLIGRFPLMAATVFVAVLGGIFSAAWPAAVPWLLGGFAILIAVRSAWSMVRQLLAGTLGIDILAITAIVATVLIGEYWAALIIVLMLTGGEALEDYAAGRARRDLSALLDRTPSIAHRVDAARATTDVPVEGLVVGDRIIVRVGELVPVDCVLASPSGEFDESSITGESLPVTRSAGDEVLSGGVNGSTAVELTVARPASESQYQRIVALVEQATGSQSPMVRLADRFAVPFTAIAYAIGGLAWWWSGNPERFAEVLVVATPCPLIIAAPVAFMAGMSRAARDGIIVKSSATLERLWRAKTVAFDKTGTLTRGEPEVIAFRPAPGVDVAFAVRLAAAAEQASVHTLAHAITAYAGDAPAAETAEELTASGVTATAEGHRIVVGRADFVAAEASGFAAADLQPGELAVYVGIDGAFAGAFVLRDEVRPDAKATVDGLRAAGILDIAMLTGDAEVTARHVAAEVGIDDVHAACLPEDKVLAVHAFADRPVVMVGDGVNDAPVLAAAEVGIAMGARGATAASQSADIVILRDDISRVVLALATGRETVQVALQSIWVGLALSLALMVVGAFGVLPAIIGAWCQEGVDVVSILWALRAVRTHPA